MSSFFNLDSTANKIGVQLYREARNAAYEQGKPNASKKLAETMANRFHSEILKAIDEETRFQTAKQV